MKTINVLKDSKSLKELISGNTNISFIVTGDNFTLV